MKTITIQQLKEFADSLEAKAKEAKDAGVRAGLYQAVLDTWTLINQQIEIKQS